MPWHQITLTTPRDQADSLEDTLLELGAVSVTLQDAADVPVLEPLPGETPLWPEVNVVGLFEDEADTAAVDAALMAQGIGGGTWLRVEDQDWERAWMDQFQPLRFGPRLWIVPSWLDAPDPEAVNILLDPGLAFGTGTHPTTALCLEWLDGAEMAGKTVLDYGCGSGILAIGALKLGATRAWGIDIDPQALTATRDNAARNGIDPERLHTGLPGALPRGETFDVLLANILMGPLIELAPTLSAHVKPGGALVLSGLLAEQAEGVMAAYAGDFDFDPPALKDGWARLSAIRR
ncbi:MAG: 50S ribosomal protein L11 methyltransferase [Halothiobacillaceae bacterium]|nr:MAG: 50S ribosomal protein L11 methyltransferase [Halothiobacillaceae bacterium]